MTERSLGPAAPSERQLLDRVWEWSDRAVEPIDAVAIARRAVDAVDGRPRLGMTSRSILAWLGATERVRAPARAPMAVLTLLLVGALLLSAVAAWVSSRPAELVPEPPPFGPARNGIIAFAGVGEDIFSYDPLTQDTRVLIATDAEAHDLQFTGDGRQLLWAEDGAQDLFIANADGSDVRRLSTLGLRSGRDNFEWSLTGDRILVTGGLGDTVVAEVIDIAEGTTTKLDLESGFTQLMLRPNHDQLLMDYSLTDADGSNPRQLVGLAPHFGSPFTLSPDGGRLAYPGLERDGGTTIHVLDIDSGTDRRIIDERSFSGFDPSGYVPHTFSPDGTQLLVGRIVGDAETLTLGIAPVDGTGPVVPIGAPEHCDWHAPGCNEFHWSPDGRQILATYPSGATWLFDVATGLGHQLPLSHLSKAWQRLAP